MKTTYKTPEIKKYTVDYQISMQLSSGSNPVAPLNHGDGQEAVLAEKTKAAAKADGEERGKIRIWKILRIMS